jgi:multicomponent Na+:H+ antiporter subunit B
VIGEYPGQVVRTICVIMAPMIMVFGAYVVAHGHYGPGGGFAGGIVIGVGIILLRLAVERELADRWLPPAIGPAAAAIGVLVFVAIGAVPLLAGEAFLDYAGTALLGSDPVDRRYLGIMVVELAVGLAVTGVMLMLFDTLSRSREP